MFKKGIEKYSRTYRSIVVKLLEALIKLYHDNLMTPAVYGSIARGYSRKDGDLDLL